MDRRELIGRAYSLGIHPIVATDVDMYMSMTLQEIAEEWDVDPVEMLAVLSRCFARSEDAGPLIRKDGEAFGDYMRRVLTALPTPKGDR